MTTHRHLPRLLCVLGATILSAAALTSPALTAPALTAPARPKPKAVLVVQGRVRAVARTPRPGSVPYKDAVTAVYLTNVKAVRGRFPHGSILVYTWGMRNNKLAPAAAYRPGQTIRLSLQPWDRVEGKYGRYQRVEIDDESALSLDAFWGEAAR